MRRLLFCGALVLFVTTSAPAQDRPRRPPENLRVLPPTTNLKVEMPKIAKALGVECGFCHVQGNFPSDEYTTKRTARRMMEMVKTMNADYFPRYEPKEGDSVLDGPVTCMTCHRGEKKPVVSNQSR